MTAPSDDTTTDTSAIIAALRAERDAGLAREAALAGALATRNSEYGERIEHQAATIDVLKAMSASPGDPQPVFDLIVERARSFCGADQCTVALLDGDMLHLKAKAGMSEASASNYAAQFPRPVNTASMFGRAILARESVQTPDVLADPEHFSRTRVGGPDPEFRAIVAVPMLRAGAPIGAIALVRRMPGVYPAIQMELLQTFAEQAVIAITSAATYRALQTRTSDLQESLEYQTATSDVLKVISGSGFALEPVFQAVVGAAVRLCSADQALLVRHENGIIQTVANSGVPPEYLTLLNELGPHRLVVEAPMVTYRAIVERRVVHIHDVTAVPGYAAEAIKLGQQRTSLGVPLLRAGEPIGSFLLARQRVEPFTDRQIELVSTFADQAVIAIENARLITEQREALEQQTATAEVLQVINASPGDLAPVFDAMLEKAMRLCGGTIGGIFTFDGGHSVTSAVRGMTAAFQEYNLKFPMDRIQPGTVPARVIETRGPVQNPDMTVGETYRAGHPYARALVELGGIRAVLAVPLLKDGVAIGMVAIYRQEPGTFTEKQIALLENFAAQAVIAIENTRLITEQREALEQQTATAEVLQVINASPGNLAPVFETILDKAHTLCGATLGSLFLFDGELFCAAAIQGYPEDLAMRLRQGVVLSATAQLLDDNVPWVHNPDLLLVDSPTARAVSGRGGVRTNLMVPLRKDGKLLGAISCNRREVRLFTDKEIALLQNFAAQAVIAMENARLIDEQREALEQQTATAEVLQVINASPGNLTPVFDAILEKAHSLCGATKGAFVTFDGQHFQLAATRGLSDAFAQVLRDADQNRTPRDELRPSEQLASGADVVQLTGPALLDGPIGRAVAELEKIRAVLFVALRRQSELLGYITAYRENETPFTDKQIALLQNFAAQAVIAMENARLITETREALEQQTATAEVLGVINASPGNLAPVFDAMLDRAMRLCDGAQGTLWMLDGERMCAAATAGYSTEFAEQLSEWREIHPFQRRLSQGERVFQIIDLAGEAIYRSGNPLTRAAVDVAGIRTVAFVALVKDGNTLGGFTIGRREVRPFTDKQIALLENFAAQAVIAIENARLMTEQREALEQQTATAEVLGVINSSPGNLTPVFEAMLDKAMRLCNAAFGSLYVLDGEHLRSVAQRGPEAYANYRAAVPPSSTGGIVADLIRGKRPIHVLDMKDRERYRAGYPDARAIVDIAGARTTVLVPFVKDDTFIGYISVFRQEVQAFSDKQIGLLENFAAQAVIAMENARLLTEQREALEQQTATAEVLQVINANPGNLAPVFETILEKAHSLCNVAVGSLSVYADGVVHTAATRGFSDEYEMLLRRPYPAIGAHLAVLRGGSSRQTPDFRMVPVSPEMASSLAHLERMHLRTGLWVPMRKDDTALGCISLYRDKVQPFSEKEIALLENFAAQAVIAMENARLLTETREALEQQTATAEVLHVINSSPGDLAPVFSAILERSTRLCDTAFGALLMYEGELWRPAAVHGPAALAKFFMNRPPWRPEPESGIGRHIVGEDIVHIADLADTGLYAQKDPGRSAYVELGQARTAMSVALRKDDILLGAVQVYRQEVRSFGEREIALLQSFAAQAVIAMENARLLAEQREALEQQTATAEVLQVINASPGNLAPVFDAMLDKAMRLCESPFGFLSTYDGEAFHNVAMRGTTPELAELLSRPIHSTPGQGLHRIVHGGEDLVHEVDITQTEGYRDGHPHRRGMADLGGARTQLQVALRKDDILLGVICIFRQVVRPFSNKQIALLQNFAAQAVVAMENARLLDEIRQRQEELRITFENMGDGVALFDETRHLVASNRRFQDMLEVPDDVISARPAFADYIRYLADRGEYGLDAEEHVQRLLSVGGQPAAFERTRPNGRIIEVRSNPVPSRGFVVIYSDITERKRSEEEIRAARDAAEEASRTIEAAYRDLKAAQANLIQAEKMASLGQLTAGIAHEIKNPLNFVNNFAALSVDLLSELKETAAPGFAALTEQQRAEVEDVSAMLTSNLEKITEHGKRADDIVKAMLEHSRGSSGERRMVDLNALIDEALNLAYHGARAQDQSFNITLERDFGAGIAPIEVNPQDMTRVFLNIFSNGFYAATRRAREGDAGFVPTLKVTTIDAGEAVEIRVRDNGTGIPADIRDKLFQPFFTTKPTGEGTGLGLSITYDIVTQQHGGSITVYSGVGEYSEFTIRLPHNP